MSIARCPAGCRRAASRGSARTRTIRSIAASRRPERERPRAGFRVRRHSLAHDGLGGLEQRLGVCGQQGQQLGVGAVGGRDDGLEEAVVLRQLEHPGGTHDGRPPRSSGCASKARPTSARNRAARAAPSPRPAGLRPDLVVDGLPADAHPVRGLVMGRPARRGHLGCRGRLRLHLRRRRGGRRPRRLRHPATAATAGTACVTPGRRIRHRWCTAQRRGADRSELAVAGRRHATPARAYAGVERARRSLRRLCCTRGSHDLERRRNGGRATRLMSEYPVCLPDLGRHGARPATGPARVPDLLVAEGRLGRAALDEDPADARAALVEAGAEAAAAVAAGCAEHPPSSRWTGGQFASRAPGRHELPGLGLLEERGRRRRWPLRDSWSRRRGRGLTAADLAPVTRRRGDPDAVHYGPGDVTSRPTQPATDHEADQPQERLPSRHCSVDPVETVLLAAISMVYK